MPKDAGFVHYIRDRFENHHLGPVAPDIFRT